MKFSLNTITTLIIYSKKLLNSDWLRKECSSSVTRVQNVLHECKLQMVSDWLKTQKKPIRTNQILAVLTTKLKKMAMVFCKQRFDFVLKTTIEKLKKYIAQTRTR